MKKVLSLLLALTMAFLFAGCQKVEITRGTIDGNVYKNDCMDFEFTKPASWVYSTDEEIAKALDIGVENFGNDNLKQALESNTSMYDMMVVDTVTRTNISVGYENLSKTFSKNITEEQYVESLKTQLENNVSGMTVTFPDKLDTVKLGDNEYTKVVCTVSAYGTSMKQVYYLQKMDGYMGFIIVTIMNGYTVADIEAMFN